jgi:hypothetical protein
MNTEAELLMALKTAVALDASAEIWDVMTHIAAHYIAQGYTQEGADVLAFVLLQANIAEDTRAMAADLFEDLESRICPRVILDAQDFARLATLDDLIEYIFAPHDV